MCFLKPRSRPKSPRQSTPKDHPEKEAEAAYYDALATHGHQSAEALVARWCWQRVRNHVGTA